MERGCQKSVINCCFCYCVSSIMVTIFEFISSILGTILNTYIFSVFKKAKDKIGFSFSIYYINFSYFGSSSVIIIILFILRKLHKIENSFGYKFGSYSTLIYSYFSKLMAVFNIIIFFYLLSFASFVTVRSDPGNVKDILPVTNIGLGGEVDLISGTPEGVKLDCDSMKCFDNEKEENVPNNNYFEYLLFVFAVILSILFMFFNGASFSSENTRISKLIKGKIEINFFPVDKISLFDKKFCELLNSITCYRLTILQLLYSISILSLISFVFLLISLILGLKNTWPQTIFFRENIFVPLGLVLYILTFIFSIYCKDVQSCNFSTPPTKRKCILSLLLLFCIFLFPLQIIGFVAIFSSQLGHSCVWIECTDEYPCDDLFTINDYYRRDKYVFEVEVHKSEGGQIFLSFILGAIPLIALFFIMVLLVSYIRRSLLEYNTLNRIYEPKLFSVEENGQKVDIDLIEVVTETIKVNKGNNNNNEEDKGDEVIVYTRKLKTNYDQNA